MRSLHEKLAKKYEVLDLLGEGATSAAYKALRLSDSELCVLKVFLKPLNADEGRLRFDRECKALARLDHPNIVKMLEWGVIDDVSYLALQYVQCETLAGRLKKSKIPWRQAVAMTATLAEALHYTHKKGMVHRDIKPQNILLLKDGSPMLIDFGLVKSGHMATHQTATGVVLGTPSYMAPELFGTEKASVSTDIYALGVVLYQLLAGKVPYSGSLENILKAKFKNPPMLPHRPGDEVFPRSLDALVAQLIEPKASNRYSGSAKDLANGLNQLLKVKTEKAVLPTKRAQQPNNELGSKRAYWPLALVLPFLIIFFVFFFGQSEEQLSAEWSLAKLGRYAKENDSLRDLAPKKACHVEVLGRLLRARLQIGKDECLAALETLKPLLASGRLEIVKRSDKLTKMAVKAVEGAAREDIGQAEEGDVLLFGLTLGKKRKVQKEQTLQLINEHFLTLSKRRRIVAKLRCLLADLQRMAIDIKAFVKDALPLLEESKQFGDESTIHRHAKLQAFADEVVPLVTLWTALVHSSSLPWQQSEPPWRMLLTEVKRLQKFPRISIFEKSASKQLSFVPFPNTLAAPLAEFYKVLLKQQNSNADFRHGARLGWQNCFSTYHFYNPQLSVNYEQLKHDCLDKQLLPRKVPLNLLPPKLLFHWIMYRAGCTLKRTAQALPHLAALDKEIYDHPGVVHTFLQVTLHLSSYGDDNFTKALINTLRKQLPKQKHPELKALLKATLIALAAEQMKLPQVDELNDGKLAPLGYAAKQFPWLEGVLPKELSDQEVGLLILLPGRRKGGQQPPKTVQLAMKRLVENWSTRRLGLPWIPRFLPILWTSGEWRQKELARQLISAVPVAKTAQQRLFALSLRCYQDADSYFDYTQSLPALRKGIATRRLALFDQEQYFSLYRTRSLAKDYFGSTARSAEAASSMLLALKDSGEIASKENVMVWLNITLLLSDVVEYMDCLTPNNLRQGIAGFTRKNKAPVVCDFGRLAVPIASSIPEELLPKGLVMLLRLHRVRLHHYARRESGNAAKILATCSAEEVPAVYRWFYWLWMLRLSVDGNGSPLRNTELNKIAKSQDYANTSAVLRVYMKAALRK
jgi:serine/threonine protein kinase